ncbi:MAG: hypothetical protein KBC38_02805 [Candidatus Pacebacteria bacterium]|nr:hypothetical protein [Candidatus Paceibacterota bacterium]MBP9840313.1 hypothetical protein [Candidatus Paceibacterota bacterium]
MTTLFLAQLFGLYFILIGLVVLLRRGSILPTIREIISNRALLFVVAVIELAAGLALTLSYPSIMLSVEGVLSLIGWMLIVEGVLYMLLPVKDVKKMVNSFNKPSWYLSGAVLSVLIGCYLAATGFALI